MPAKNVEKFYPQRKRSHFHDKESSLIRRKVWQSCVPAFVKLLLSCR